ncbi:GCN5-related N-acetyltransferase [Thermodesulfatator indicus DSM 15286]|uniref:GCN5-related N-acetyltransferase n=1 Tax=Thermodesulfatator indicus (strain DSM 15286 / JCM 11887 / CIR29812) TaxID=667014 RepID=F8A8A7_THEID|nr:N-acetyltransferase [Thermodesulfatator indicus]AEH44685.1 GCN5-related N-acetyltransferase [Thermodesulfatator indicus DSM 15286]
MIRKARLKDARDIHRLIVHFSKTGQVLPRPLAEIYENIREFFVFAPEGKDLIAGACALHICWEDLAEIRSLVVSEEYQGEGVGVNLVKACLEEARDLGVPKVFVLTNAPDFFRKLHFKDIEKTELPHKVWADCVKCPKFPECDEEALILELGQEEF